MTGQVDTLRTQLHTRSVEQLSEGEEPHTNRTQQNNQSVSSTQSYTNSVQVPNINILDAQTSGLSARGLSERLGVSHVTVGRKVKKGADIFAVWSKELDPDGLVWELRGDKYYPMLQSQPP